MTDSGPYPWALLPVMLNAWLTPYRS